jgi:hypothetical protein
MKQSIIAFSVLTLLLFSCKKEIIPADEVELGKDYYPLTTGHFIDYAVDSIVYNDFNQTTDTFKLEFKDEIEDQFLDNEGRTSYSIQRYYRQDSTYLWDENQTYYATTTSFKLEVVENNLRFIKLVFPVKLNTRWYGNTYIPASSNSDLQWLDGWDYKYLKVSEPFNNGKIEFTNTVTVTQVDNTEGAPDDPNQFSAHTFSKEVYAKNVGLVYRELTRWVYQPTVAKYKKGFTLIMRAKNYN